MTLPVWGVRQPLPPPAPLPDRAEVVIVGGGITGLSLLHELRSRDVHAILLERDHVAAGASGRNAGFLLVGVAENYARAVAVHGRAVAQEVWEFTRRNHELIAAVATDAGYHRGGSLTVALDEAEAASLDEAATLLSEDGLPGQLVDGGSVPEAVRCLRTDADGEIDPVRLCRGLAARQATAVHEQSPVIAVEDGQNVATVQLEDRTVEADAIVLAVNAWTAELVDGIPIRPVRAQMLATAVEDARVAGPVYAEWGHRYWRQRDDGVVLVGGFRHRALDEEVGYDIRPTEAVQRHLDAQARLLGVTAPVTHRWAGTMGFSHDGLPLAGRVPGAARIHVCGGYTGHGMGFAMHAARALTDALLDSVALPGWLDVARVPAPAEAGGA